MSEVSACPLDGNLRRVVASDRYSTTWKCGWCQQHYVEEVTPDVRLDLQREFDR